MRPLTDTIPKCLVEIHGRPLLDYWLDHLFTAGIDRILINCHWLADRVQAHVASSRWRARVDLVHEEKLLGTGGTILANRAWLDSGPFLVAHADNLTDFAVANFVAAHHNRPRECLITMLAFRTDDPRSCGILECDDSDVLRAFHEKVENPPGDLANAAVYIMEPEVIYFIASKGRSFVDLSTEVLPAYIGRILVHVTSGYHRDIGTLASLRLAEVQYPRVQQR